MCIICDNSSLSALAEMEMLEVLFRVLGNIHIPASVAAEGSHSAAPEALRKWLAMPPEWVSILADPSEFLEETQSLGRGESAAITLAWQHRDASLIVLDERRGRNVAKSLGLRTTGLLAILVEAAIAGEIEFEDALKRLLGTGFRLSQELMNEARAVVRQGQKSDHG